jgi:mRNA-degrading endonuclease RelE of RelBE toxin-antitoxin system
VSTVPARGHMRAPTARRCAHRPGQFCFPAAASAVVGGSRYDPGAMVTNRRARPTIRCLTEDLGSEIPGLDVGIGDIEGAWLDELRRIAPVSPQGQKRILAIVQPVVYRLRVGSFRGATWVDEGNGIVWLCAVHRREQDSDDDAYAWFADLHAKGSCSRRRMTGCAIARRQSSGCSGPSWPGCCAWWLMPCRGGEKN